MQLFLLLLAFLFQGSAATFFPLPACRTESSCKFRTYTITAATLILVTDTGPHRNCTLYSMLAHASSQAALVPLMASPRIVVVAQTDSVVFFTATGNREGTKNASANTALGPWDPAFANAAAGYAAVASTLWATAGLPNLTRAIHTVTPAFAFGSFQLVRPASYSTVYGFDFGWPQSRTATLCARRAGALGLNTTAVCAAESPYTCALWGRLLAPPFVASVNTTLPSTGIAAPCEGLRDTTSSRRTSRSLRMLVVQPTRRVGETGPLGRVEPLYLTSMSAEIVYSVEKYCRAPCQSVPDGAGTAYLYVTDTIPLLAALQATKLFAYSRGRAVPAGVEIFSPLAAVASDAALRAVVPAAHYGDGQDDGRKAFLRLQSFTSKLSSMSSPGTRYVGVSEQFDDVGYTTLLSLWPTSWTVPLAGLGATTVSTQGNPKASWSDSAHPNALLSPVVNGPTGSLDMSTLTHGFAEACTDAPHLSCGLQLAAQNWTVSARRLQNTTAARARAPIDPETENLQQFIPSASLSGFSMWTRAVPLVDCVDSLCSACEVIVCRHGLAGPFLPGSDTTLHPFPSPDAEAPLAREWSETVTVNGTSHRVPGNRLVGSYCWVIQRVYCRNGFWRVSSWSEVTPGIIAFSVRVDTSSSPQSQFAGCSVTSSLWFYNSLLNTTSAYPASGSCIALALAKNSTAVCPGLWRAPQIDAGERSRVADVQLRRSVMSYPISLSPFSSVNSARPSAVVQWSTASPLFVIDANTYYVVVGEGAADTALQRIGSVDLSVDDPRVLSHVVFGRLVVASPGGVVVAVPSVVSKNIPAELCAIPKDHTGFPFLDGVGADPVVAFPKSWNFVTVSNSTCTVGLYPGGGALAFSGPSGVHMVQPAVCQTGSTQGDVLGLPNYFKETEVVAFEPFSYEARSHTSEARAATFRYDPCWPANVINDALLQAPPAVAAWGPAMPPSGLWSFVRPLNTVTNPANITDVNITSQVFMGSFWVTDGSANGTRQLSIEVWPTMIGPWIRRFAEHLQFSNGVGLLWANLSNAPNPSGLFVTGPVGALKEYHVSSLFNVTDVAPLTSDVSVHYTHSGVGLVPLVDSNGTALLLRPWAICKKLLPTATEVGVEWDGVLLTPFEPLAPLPRSRRRNTAAVVVVVCIVLFVLLLLLWRGYLRARRAFVLLWRYKHPPSSVRAQPVCGPEVFIQRSTSLYFDGSLPTEEIEKQRILDFGTALSSHHADLAHLFRAEISAELDRVRPEAAATRPGRLAPVVRHASPLPQPHQVGSFRSATPADVPSPGAGPAAPAAGHSASSTPVNVPSPFSAPPTGVVVHHSSVTMPAPATLSNQVRHRRPLIIDDETDEETEEDNSSSTSSSSAGPA